MYPRILTFLMKASFMLIAMASTAGEKSASPFNFTLQNLSAAEKAIEASNASAGIFSVNAEKKEKNKSRVCACEILKLSNNNADQENVAIFSEITNNGDINAEYKTALEILQKQKKNMKDQYYDKVKVNQTITAPMDCKTLYMKMSKSDGGLVMYDIIDADIMSALKNAK
jgi:flagellar basal body rod protein FlgB